MLEVIGGRLRNVALVAYAAALGTVYGQTKDQPKACLTHTFHRSVEY